MSRKSYSPALPLESNPSLRHGFTAWVELHRTGAVDVLAYRRALDRHLEARGLVRSMNPLHMLVYSPERSLTCTDQAQLLGWMVMTGYASRLTMCGLRSHVGIPTPEDRQRLMRADLTDPRWDAVLEAWHAGRSAEWVLRQMLRISPSHA